MARDARRSTAVGPLIAAWLRGDAGGMATAWQGLDDGARADAAPRLVTAARRAAQEQHQFAALPATAIAAHAAAAEAVIAALVGAPDDHAALARAVAAEVTARAALRPSGAPVVTCGTYAPLLQLDLLGLELGTLATPVLDVGCGPRALLVAALRARGLDARGVDRHLDDDVEGAARGDWEGALPAPASQGTIVSHLALSLHFLHASAAAPGGDEARRLAWVWQRLTLGLRVGGVLAYVPGLPMLERSLRRPTWEVTRRPLPAELEAALAPLCARLGEDVAYAAKVERRA